MIGIGKSGITKLVAAILVAIVVIAGVALGTYYFLTMTPPHEEPETPIKVGVALSQTGAYGALGYLVLNGYNLWVDQINARGGLLGRNVTLVAYDDKSDSVTTKSLYERLITVDDVDLLLGPYTSVCAFAMMPVAEKYHVNVIQPLNNAIKLYIQGWEHIFLALTVGVPTWVSYTQSVTWFNSMDPKPTTFAIRNAADLFCRDTADNIAGLLIQNGFKQVGREETPKDVTDLSSVITKIKNANPDIFFDVGYLSDAVLAVRTAKELGWNPKVWECTTGGNVKPYADALGKDANGVYFFTAFTEFSPDPMVQAFNTAYQAKYNAIPDLKGSSAYASCQLLEAAVKGTGTLDHEAIRTWLMQNTVKTVFGNWSVDFNFRKEYWESGEKKTAEFKYIAEPSYYLSQWQNGTAQVIMPVALRTATPLYPKPAW